VLRQPEARTTGVADLDACYVYTFDQEVGAAIASIKKGLEEEGMGDLSEHLNVNGGHHETERVVTIRRAAKFNNLKILLPRVLHRDNMGTYRPLDYDRDILGNLNGNTFSFTKKFDADEAEMKRTVVVINMERHDGQFELALTKTTEKDVRDEEIDFPFMVRHLMDIVPNPWQASRIMQEVLDVVGSEIPRERLYANRLFLLQEIRRYLAAIMHEGWQA